MPLHTAIRLCTIVLVLVIMLCVVIMYCSRHIRSSKEQHEQYVDVVDAQVHIIPCDKTIDEGPGAQINIPYRRALEDSNALSRFPANAVSNADIAMCNQALITYPKWFSSGGPAKTTEDVYNHIRNSAVLPSSQEGMVTFESNNFVCFVYPGDVQRLQEVSFKRALWALECFTAILHVHAGFDFAERVHHANHESLRTTRIPFYINKRGGYCSNPTLGCAGSIGSVRIGTTDLQFAEQYFESSNIIDVILHEYFHMVQRFVPYSRINEEDWYLQHEATARFTESIWSAFTNRRNGGELLIPAPNTFTFPTNKIDFRKANTTNVYDPYNRYIYWNLLAAEFGLEFFGRYYTDPGLPSHSVLHRLVAALDNPRIRNVLELMGFWCRAYNINLHNHTNSPAPVDNIVGTTMTSQITVSDMEYYAFYHVSISRSIRIVFASPLDAARAKVYHSTKGVAATTINVQEVQPDTGDHFHVVYVPEKANLVGITCVKSLDSMVPHASSRPGPIFAIVPV